jgi:hypothetical protein
MDRMADVGMHERMTDVGMHERMTTVGRELIIRTEVDALI